MVEMSGQKLAQFDCKKSEKTLGIMIDLALMQDCEFLMMVNTMKKAIGKLKMQQY